MELAEIKQKLRVLLAKAQALIVVDLESCTEEYHALLKEYQNLLNANVGQKSLELERDFQEIREKLKIAALPFFTQAAAQRAPSVSDPDEKLVLSGSDDEEEVDDVNEAVGNFFEYLGQLSKVIETMKRAQASGSLIAWEALDRAYKTLSHLQQKRKEYLAECTKLKTKPEHLEVDGQLEVMEAQLIAMLQNQKELVQSTRTPSFSAAVQKLASAVPPGAICAPEDMRKALEQVYQVPATQIEQAGTDNVFKVDYSSSNNAPKTVIFNLAANAPRNSVEFQEHSTLEDYVKAAIILRAAGQRFNFDDQAMRDNPKMKALCVQASQIVGLELKGELSCDRSFTNDQEYRHYADISYEEIVTKAAETMKRPVPSRRSDVVLEGPQQSAPAQASLPKQGSNRAAMFSHPAEQSHRVQQSQGAAPSRTGN